MKYRIGKPLLLSFALLFLLAACADEATPQATDEPAATVESSDAATPAATAEPVEPATATPAPIVTPEPTATVVPLATSEPVPGALPAAQTVEALLVPPDFVLNELASYQAEYSGLSFDYPAGWIVSENPDGGGIRIESKEGISDRLMTDYGVSVVVLPLTADELPGETPIQKLASFIISSGASSTTAMGDPLTGTVNGQELAFSSFVDQQNGLEGVYAAYVAGDEVAVIFAIAGGENRVSYRPGVETIVNSLILAQGD